jgi:hypothetical protein
MTADWYLLLAVMGPFAGFLLLVAAGPFVIYSFCARNIRRGRTASRIGLALCLVAVLTSALLWKDLITGYYRYDQPVNYGDPDFIIYEVIAGLELLALLTSVLSAMRHRARPAS